MLANWVLRAMILMGQWCSFDYSMIRYNMWRTLIVWYFISCCPFGTIFWCLLYPARQFYISLQYMHSLLHKNSQSNDVHVRVLPLCPSGSIALTLYMCSRNMTGAQHCVFYKGPQFKSPIRQDTMSFLCNCFIYWSYTGNDCCT